MTTQENPTADVSQEISVRSPLRRMNLIRVFDEMECGGGDPGLTPVWVASVCQSGGQEKPPAVLNHQVHKSS
jgi:hypothetical protein